MIQIEGEAAVSLYMNVFAFMLILSLVSLSHRLTFRRTSEDKLFLYVCAASAVNSACGIIYATSKAVQSTWSGLLMTMCVTAGRLSVLLLLFLWIIYVDFRLNRSRDHLIRRYPVMLVPMGIIFILFVSNIFTGILFTIDENLNVHQTILYHCLFGVNMLFFVISVVVFFRYKKAVGSLSFFYITPFAVPVVAGAAGEFLCFYASETAGFAIGLVFMYFSMLTCWKYEDKDPAFYNLSYLNYVCDCIRNGKSPIKSAVEFIGKDEDTLASILKTALPIGHETIHLAKNRFLYLSSRSNLNNLNALTAMIRSEAEEYDAVHPDATLSLETVLHYQPKDQSGQAGWLEVFESKAEV